jgi:DNA-binding LacI/PurR family transcriptional regulator
LNTPPIAAGSFSIDKNAGDLFFKRRKGNIQMIDQGKKIVMAAPSFQSAIYIALHDQLKRLFKAEEITLRSLKDDPVIQKERLMQALENVRPSALIVVDIRLEAEIVAAYTAANIPIVLIDEEAEGASLISVDNIKGGQIAGEYLAKKGRKKIAIVSGRTQVKGGFNAEQRLKGFKQALNAQGLSIPFGCTIEVANYSRDDGLEVMPKLLDMGIDAVFCAAGDSCALGLMSAAKEQGKRIPEDVSIVGFDDLLVARLSTPTLTTIKQPLEKIAEAAYKMIVIDRDEILLRPRKLVFNPELVIRQSA